MEAWWYSIEGENIRRQWDGSTLPEKADYLNIDFLNQFAKRLNHRIALYCIISGWYDFGISAMISGSTLATSANPNVGSIWQGFTKQFLSAVERLRNIPNAIPSAGESYQITLRTCSDICISELGVLRNLSAGDVFNAKALFSAMYSILAKTKTFATYDGSIKAPIATAYYQSSRSNNGNLITDVLQNDSWRGKSFSNISAYNIPYNGGYRRTKDYSGYETICIHAPSAYYSLPSPTRNLAVSACVYGYGLTMEDVYESSEYPNQGKLYSRGSFNGVIWKGNSIHIPVGNIGVASIDNPDTQGYFYGYDSRFLSVFTCNDDLLVE